MDWEVIHGKYSFMKEIGRCCIVLHKYEYSYKAIFSLNLIQKSDYAFSRVFRNQKFEPIPSEQFEHTHSEYRMPWKRWNCMPGHHIFPHHFFVKLELCRICMSMPNPICADQQCYPWIILFCAVLRTVICDKSWKWSESFVISSSKHEMCFHVFHPWSLLHFRAHQAWSASASVMI